MSVHFSRDTSKCFAAFHLLRGRPDQQDVDRETQWLTSLAAVIIRTAIGFNQLHVVNLSRIHSLLDQIGQTKRADDGHLSKTSIQHRNRKQSFHFSHFSRFKHTTYSNEKNKTNRYSVQDLKQKSIQRCATLNRVIIPLLPRLLSSF